MLRIDNIAGRFTARCLIAAIGILPPAASFADASSSGTPAAEEDQPYQYGTNASGIGAQEFQDKDSRTTVLEGKSRDLENRGSLEGNLDKAQSDIKTLFEDVPFEFRTSGDGTISIRSGNMASGLSVQDRDLADLGGDEEKQLLEEAKAAGEQKRISAAADKGNQVAASGQGESAGQSAARTRILYGISQSNVVNGTVDLSNDPDVNILRKALDPNDPNSVLNNFTDACKDGFEYTTSSKTVYSGENKTCLSYLNTSASCTVKHDYEVKVVSEVSPEYPIALKPCVCQSHDRSCTDDSLKKCVNFSVGYAQENYLKPEGYLQGCLGFRRVGKIRIDSSEALEKVVLDNAQWDDVLALYIYKEDEKPDYSHPVWKTHAQLPVRNYWYAPGENMGSDEMVSLAHQDANGVIARSLPPEPNPSPENFCKLKTINGTCQMPWIVSKVLMSLCPNGGCGGATHFQNEKYMAPMVDFFTGQKMDDPANGHVGECEFYGAAGKPAEDITQYFKGAKEGDVYNIEMIVTVGGEGDGYLHFRAEYDPSKAILTDTWTPDECIRIANGIDWESKTQEGLVYCSSLPENMTETNDGDYCAVLANGHSICGSAFDPAPFKNVRGYDETTGELVMTEINPLCREVRVSGESVLSPSEDYLDQSCGELLKTAEAEGKSCSMKKSVCKQTTREADEIDYEAAGIEITGEAGGNCYLREYTYNCGSYEEVPVTAVTKKTSCIDMIKTCEGGSCVGFDNDQNFTQDLARTSAVLQAVDFMVQDMTCAGTGDTEEEQAETQECEIFRGEKSQCHIFDTKATYQNCCKDMTGANVNSYISSLLKVSRLVSSKQLLGGMIDKLDPLNLTSKTLDKSISITEAVHAKQLSWVDSITGVEGSGAFSENVAIVVLAAVYEEAIQEFIQKMVQKVAVSILEGIGGVAGKVGADSAKQAAKELADKISDKAIDEGAQQAGSEFLSTVGSAVSIVGTVYMIYSMVDMALKMIFKCDKDDFMTASNRALKKCTEVGSTCKIKVLGKCVDRYYHYCCYSSPLARIINEQIALSGQLGRTYPDKTCRGISVDDLSSLDWDKIDLTEWTQLIISAGEYQFNEDQQKAQELLAERQRSELADNANRANSLGDDPVDALVNQYRDRFNDPAIMAAYASLPAATRQEIEHREYLYELEAQVGGRYGSGREADQAFIVWSKLPAETKKEIEDLERQISKGYMDSYYELSVQERIKVDNVTALLTDEYGSAAAFDGKSTVIKTVDPESEAAGNAVIATQMNLGLQDYCKLSVKQAARAITEYRVDITNNAYDAIKDAYISDTYSAGVTQLIKNHQKEKCVSGSYRIAMKAANVENITGADSVLDINKSSSRPDLCGEGDDCHRQSARTQLENTLDNLQESGGYKTLDDYRKEVEDRTPYNVNGAGMTFSSE